MNPGLNILDQLLLPNPEGLPDVGPSRTDGPAGAPNPFAILLNELFGKVSNDDGPEPPKVSSEETVPISSNRTEATALSATNQLPFAVVLARYNPVLRNLTGAQVESDQAEIEGQGGIIENTRTVLTDGIVEKINQELPAGVFIADADRTVPDLESASGKVVLPTDESLELPKTLSLNNESLRRLLREKPMDLVPGTYDVDKAELIGDKINLTVTSRNKPDEQIRIVLPVKVLDNLKMADAPERVSLDGLPQSRRQLERLFADLNLRQIEISQEPKSEPTRLDPQKPAAITLTVEDDSRSFEIKSRLMPHNIAATSKRDSDNEGLSVDRVAPVTKNYQNQNGSNDTDYLVLRPAKPHAATVAPERNTFESSSAVTDSRTEAANDPVRFDTFVRDRSTETEVSRSESRPVRFDLPEKLNHMLKPNGRSVMLRIQPDHLGPARLKLSMHHDSIRATLTVETHEAKALLEGSLDKLTQQLQKSDIKFDHIEVNVGGDDRRDHLFEQRPNWSRRPQFINGNPEARSTTPEAVSIVPPVYGQPRVGNSGVNVLA